MLLLIQNENMDKKEGKRYSNASWRRNEHVLHFRVLGGKSKSLLLICTSICERHFGCVKNNELLSRPTNYQIDWKDRQLQQFDLEYSRVSLASPFWKREQLYFLKTCMST